MSLIRFSVNLVSISFSWHPRTVAWCGKWPVDSQCMRSIVGLRLFVSKCASSPQSNLHWPPPPFSASCDCRSRQPLSRLFSHSLRRLWYSALLCPSPCYLPLVSESTSLLSVCLCIPLLSDSFSGSCILAVHVFLTFAFGGCQRRRNVLFLITLSKG